jgi:hypothetical protein
MRCGQWGDSFSPVASIGKAPCAWGPAGSNVLSFPILFAKYILGIDAITAGHSQMRNVLVTMEDGPSPTAVAKVTLNPTTQLQPYAIHSIEAIYSSFQVEMCQYLSVR